MVPWKAEESRFVGIFSNAEKRQSRRQPWFPSIELSIFSNADYSRPISRYTSPWCVSHVRELCTWLIPTPLCRVAATIKVFLETKTLDRSGPRKSLIDARATFYFSYLWIFLIVSYRAGLQSYCRFGKFSLGPELIVPFRFEDVSSSRR